MGEACEGTNLLREPDHFQLVEVKDFLQKECIGIPSDATNPLCYRVEAGELWNDYKEHCRKYSFIPLNKAEFALSVEWVFPTARLSQWRFVEGQRVREFDGIIRCKRLCR